MFCIVAGRIHPAVQKNAVNMILIHQFSDTPNKILEVIAAGTCLISLVSGMGRRHKRHSPWLNEPQIRVSIPGTVFIGKAVAGIDHRFHSVFPYGAETAFECCLVMNIQAGKCFVCILGGMIDHCFDTESCIALNPAFHFGAHRLDALSISIFRQNRIRHEIAAFGFFRNFFRDCGMPAVDVTVFLKIIRQQGILIHGDMTTEAEICSGAFGDTD